MTNPYRGLELLAPAGSPACLHAGVSAGADAVYLGCENFNARRNADNFTLENLTEACDYAHMRGVRVYLALNIAIMPEELKPSLDLAISAWNRGVDAFIVQDIGLAAEIKRALPDARLHISTQMNTHNIEGVRAAAALGAQRITMARELTCEELEEATAEAHRLGIETECFAHGALCVCYSGQCLMSSMIGGRSANRGTCAQACRLPYVLRDEDSDSEILTKDGDRLLSPKDLCTIDMLEKLAATGVDSLKIEGRMKSPEYVFAVVSTYRAVLDRLAHACDEGLNPSEMAVLDEERRTLSEAFSRGFTEAYLAHKRGNDIMGYGRANNRGVFVGRVAKANGREVAIESNVELNEGDVLEFWTNRGHFASTLASFEKSNGTYYFEVDGKAYKGDRVFRVRDASMAFHDSEYEPKLPVKLKVQAHIGQPLTFFAECAGAKATFSGAIVEPARTKALSIDEAREHIDRLGNTPFFLSDLDIDIDDGVGMGFSALHKARSQALKALREAMLDPWRGRCAQKAPKNAGPKSEPICRNASVSAYATNPACARAAKKAGADTVFVSALNYRRGQASCEGRIAGETDQAGYPGRCSIAMPIVDKPPMNSEEPIDMWKWAKEGKPLFVENLGQLVLGAELNALVEVGPHLPITNKQALNVAHALGANRVWLSPELSMKQINQLSDGSPVELGIIICGNQELMVCEHCVIMSEGACNQKCSQCDRRRRAHTVQDRKGYRFPVVTDVFGRSHIYNAVRFDAIHAIAELMDAGVTAFMVDTTLMSPDEAAKTTARVIRAIEAAKHGSSTAKAQGCTTGHLFRGVQ